MTEYHRRGLYLSEAVIAALYMAAEKKGRKVKALLNEILARYLRENSEALSRLAERHAAGLFKFPPYLPRPLSPDWLETAFFIKRDIYEQLRFAAAAKGVSMRFLIEEILREGLNITEDDKNGRNNDA